MKRNRFFWFLGRGLLLLLAGVRRRPVLTNRRDVTTTLQAAYAGLPRRRSTNQKPLLLQGGPARLRQGPRAGPDFAWRCSASRRALGPGPALTLVRRAAQRTRPPDGPGAPPRRHRPGELGGQAGRGHRARRRNSTRSTPPDPLGADAGERELDPRPLGTRRSGSYEELLDRRPELRRAPTTRSATSTVTAATTTRRSSP